MGRVVLVSTAATGDCETLMGKRSSSETVAGILVAFIERRTWQQAQLARRLQLQPRAVRKHLEELMQSGCPLVRDDEPPHVYWSVPKGWFPGGLYLSGDDAELSLTLLCRLPASPSRDTLLERISASHPERAARTAELRSVIQEGDDQEPLLALVTEAAARKQALHLHYFSATRGALEWRHVSVQRVMPGPPARFVAHCHRSSTLKWFRVRGIVAAKVAPAVAYVPAERPALDDFVSTSVDGFHTPGFATEHRFFVPDPDARWVERNLLSSMSPERTDGGLRVTCRTPSLLRVARFVLSLAPMARAETPELSCLVRQLAQACATAHHQAQLENAEGTSASTQAEPQPRVRRALPRRRNAGRRRSA